MSSGGLSRLIGSFLHLFSHLNPTKYDSWPTADYILQSRQDSLSWTSALRQQKPIMYFPKSAQARWQRRTELRDSDPREATERDETFLNANMWARSRCTGDSQEKNHLLIQTRHAKNEMFIMIHGRTSVACVVYFNWNECWACPPAMLNVPINKNLRACVCVTERERES